MQTINTFFLDKKWSLHFEFQGRMEHGLKNWHQTLLRAVAN